MDFSTNHDPISAPAEYSLRIDESLDNGINYAEIGVTVGGFIDSRTELAMEIRKNALAFLKRAVEQLEKENEV